MPLNRHSDTRLNLRDLSDLLKSIPPDQIKIKDQSSLEKLLDGINKIITRYTNQMERYRQESEEIRKDLHEEKKDKKDLMESLDSLLTLQKLSEVISTSREVENIFPSLLSLCHQVVDFSGSGIFIIESQNANMECIFQENLNQKEIKKIHTQLEDGIIDWVLAEKTATLIPDMENTQHESSEKASHFIIIPLTVRNQGMGVWVIRTYTNPGEVTRHDLDMLSLLGNQAAVAIENSKLYQDMNKRISELTILNEISRSWGNPQDLPELLASVAKIAAHYLNATFSLLYLKNQDSNKLELAASYGTKTDPSGEPLETGIDLDQEPFQSILYSNKPLSLSNRGYNRFAGILRRKEATTLVAVPIHYQLVPEGLILVGCSATLSRDIEQYENVLMTIANQAGVAIKNLRLYTELIESNRSLLEMQHQLSQAGKLASIGELAGGVAHEINNPLQIILGRVQMVKTKLQKSNKKEFKELEVVETETIRISEIVKGLLTFSRKQDKNLPRRPLDLAKLIEETRRLVAHQFRLDGVKLALKLDKTSLLTLGFSNQIKQVFLNLFNNARQALNKKGKLDVLAQKKKETIEIIFSDNGPGIPAKNIDRIFEPFFTTKDTKGTGLGLSLSYAIIKDHQGELKVESVKNKGAIFTIHLPAFSEA